MKNIPDWDFFIGPYFFLRSLSDDQRVGLGPLPRHHFDSRLSSFFVDFHPLPQHHRALIDAVALWQSPTTRDAPTGTYGRFGILTSAVVALAP